MLKSELVKNSPLRILEKTTHGGVGKGNLGAIASKPGVGKTACLVHIATDQLLQGKHVIHVSFTKTPAHIISWYEDIFQELSVRLALENTMDVHDDLVKNRVIMNFHQAGVKIDMVARSLRSMIKDGGFKADCVIVDGFDFSQGTLDDIRVFKALAEELAVEIWFSVSLKDENMAADQNGIPALLAGYVDLFAIVISLTSEEGFIRLNLRKDHDNKAASDLHLRLDPKILLITRD